MQRTQMCMGSIEKPDFSRWRCIDFQANTPGNLVSVFDDARELGVLVIFFEPANALSLTDDLLKLSLSGAQKVIAGKQRCCVDSRGCATRGCAERQCQ